MPTYGSLARPAYSMCQGNGARAVAHAGFKFGAVEVAEALPRELAQSMGLVLIPSACEWPALAAEAAQDIRLGDADTRRWYMATDRGRAELDDTLDDAIRALGIFATRAEMLAALAARD